MTPTRMFEPRLFLAAAAIALTALALAPMPAAAIGGEEETPAATPAMTRQYETAKRAIDAKRYRVAIPILQDVIRAEPKNANAYNLLAYSERKLGDLDKAFGHYRIALTLDPEHRGAHEYLGELYLTRGDLGSAETMRERLSQLCRGECEELEDLDKAIAAFKAGRATH